MQKSQLRKLLLTALFTALTAAGALLHIGDASLQTMFSVMSGILLGPIWGPVSQLLYVGMGLMGLPIFVSGGGPLYAVHPTFGFLLGMILASFITGILTEKTEWNIWLISSIGFLSVYVIGLPFFYFITRYYIEYENNAKVSFILAVKAVIVYLPMDLGKLFVAAPVSKKLLPSLRKDLYEYDDE